MNQTRLKLKPKKKPRGWWKRYAQKLEALLMLERVQLAAAMRKLDSLRQERAG